MSPILMPCCLDELLQRLFQRARPRTARPSASTSRNFASRSLDCGGATRFCKILLVVGELVVGTKKKSA